MKSMNLYSSLVVALAAAATTAVAGCAVGAEDASEADPAVQSTSLPCQEAENPRNGSSAQQPGGDDDQGYAENPDEEGNGEDINGSPQGDYGAPQGNQAPVQGGYGAPQGNHAPVQGGYGAPQGNHAPVQGGYGAPQGNQAPVQSGYGAPQGNQAPVQSGYGAPQGNCAPSQGYSASQGGMYGDQGAYDASYGGQVPMAGVYYNQSVTYQAFGPAAGYSTNAGCAQSGYGMPYAGMGFTPYAIYSYPRFWGRGF